MVRACLKQLTILANVNSIPNTPAGDSWNLYLGYTPAGSFTETLLPITFLPTGEIDMSASSQSLDTANAILAPTIDAMRLQTGDPEFDFWKFMNWVVVSYYWLFLYDFGQTSPLTTISQIAALLMSLRQSSILLPTTSSSTVPFSVFIPPISSIYCYFCQRFRHSNSSP